jgi:hypothetical protein
MIPVLRVTGKNRAALGRSSRSGSPPCRWRVTSAAIRCTFALLWRRASQISTG